MDSEIWPVSTIYYRHANLGQMHHPGFARMIKERFQWQKGLTFESVWSPLSYEQIGMPVIGKRLQQNQCRKVLKPKKPRDLRGLKASNVAGPKKEILLKTRHQAPREIRDFEHQMIWNTRVLWGSLYTSPPGLRQPSRFVVLPWQKAYCPEAAAPNTTVWQWYVQAVKSICRNLFRSFKTAWRWTLHSKQSCNMAPFTNGSSSFDGAHLTKLGIKRYTTWFMLSSDTHAHTISQTFAYSATLMKTSLQSCSVAAFSSW